MAAYAYFAMNFSVLKIFLCISVLLIFSSMYFMQSYHEISDVPLNIQYNTTNVYNNNTKKKFLIYTPGCSIPKYNPFDARVKKYYIKTSSSYGCSSKKTIFYVKENGVISLDESALFLEYKLNKNQIDCTFRPITRLNKGRKPDDTFVLGKEHHMIFDLPIEDDSVLLKCKAKNRTIITRAFLLTPFKEEVEKRCDKIKSQQKLSVVIVGIDSISKLNFIRYFKKTFQILKSEFQPIELNGFVKVADNTYPNLIAFLTGRHRSYYKFKERKFRYYDDVDFIWKRFADNGYRTLFSEDAPSMGTFVLNRRGFRHPPTDYYSRPFSVAVETLNLRHKTHCIGDRLEMEVYFDYLINFVSTMKNRLIFTFTFIARLTHDILKYAGYADKPSHELIVSLNETGVLNRSLLIFFSDHGIRFGGIRRTYIGQIEERMPFMFLLFPDWFLKKFPTYAKNLHINENRLTTPYDIHATLLHLLNLDEEQFHTMHGQSLLSEIRAERTCSDAMITKHWCTCQFYSILSKHDSNVRSAALLVVRKINQLLTPFMRYCVPLRLSKILDARIALQTDYLITLQVNPSGAIFEATLQKRTFHFIIQDEVSRINRYANQSKCVEDAIIKKYCFCRHQ
ncbi:uncharacterized protein [Parasteatoda tepidariorum]|uniref:uncharacterized protein n=1 Tax=Parasteatoda tepidariorum TaxID=114398 RepID=UPI00077FBD3F|nr:uncharacterized protein LOC107453356 [Parasteatoda tepidariorum]